MIETKLCGTPIAIISDDPSDVCLEVTRLLTAAVINPGFCKSLLDNPALAIKGGFQGEDFAFTDEKCDLITSLGADSLPDLAKQLARTFISDPNTYTIPAIQPNAVFRY